MYPYQQAADTLAAMDKEIAVGNLFQTDAASFAAQLVDTIGWWESNDERVGKLIAKKDDTIVDLAERVADLQQEMANVRCGARILSDQVLDLSEERNTLVDENVDLMHSHDQLLSTIAAIENVLEIAR